MKILMITDLYPLSESDVETSRTMYNYVQMWNSLGHQVDVIKPNFILDTFLNKQPLYKTGWYENVYNVNYLTPFLFDVKLKLKEFDFSKYDKIFAFNPVGEIFASRLGVNFIAGIRSADFDHLTDFMRKFYFKTDLENAYKKATQIACRSYSVKTRFIKEFPMHIHKTYVTTSGLDFENSSILESPNKTCYMDGIKSAYRRILISSDSSENELVSSLINTCKNLEEAQLTVISDNKEKFKQMTSDVVYLAKLSQDRLFERMRASDIFVVSSLNNDAEDLTINAMKNGCIVLLVNDSISGVSVIKDGENGFTCSLENLEAKLSEIIKRNDLKEIAKNAKEFINKTVPEITV